MSGENKSRDLVSEYFKKVIDLYNSDKYEGQAQEIITMCEKVLQIDPNYTDALGIKGVSLNELGKYRESIEVFDAVLKTNPNHIEALRHKGSALWNSGEAAEAIVTLSKVLELDPNNERVIKTFEKIGVVPLHIDAFTDTSMTLSELGKPSKETRSYTVSTQYMKSEEELKSHAAQTHFKAAEDQELQSPSSNSQNKALHNFSNSSPPKDYGLLWVLVVFFTVLTFIVGLVTIFTGALKN